jgi:hypothetical protein
MSSTRITDYLGAGLAASRPASPTVPAGALAEYIATDTGAISVWNGTSWVTLGAGAGTVTQVVAGAGLAGGTITATGTLSLGTIAASSLFGNAGTVAAVPGAVAIGSGLSLAAGGTLTATSSGTVTQVVAGAGLSGGTITAAGTINLGTIAAGDLFGNPGTVGAVGSGVAVGSGLTLSSAGTLSATSSGSVTSVATSGAGISGGPITGSGTLTVEWNAGTIAALGDGVGLNSGTIQVDHQGTITLSGTTTGTIAPAQGVASELVNVGTAAGTISVGAGLYAGQHLRVEILQGATAQTVAFDSTVEFGTDITAYTATAVASKRDLVQLIWNSSASKWMFAAVNHGFS